MLIYLPLGGCFTIGKCLWSDVKIPCLAVCANDLPVEKILLHCKSFIFFRCKNGHLVYCIAPYLRNGVVFVIAIKKYANRRLYNVATSSYITLSELAEMVRSGEKIHISDAKTGQDLTRPTLVQVILECEQEGHQMLPVDVLCQIIMAYKSPIEPLLSRYLERTMASFTRLHPLASQALENSLDAISQNSDFRSEAPDKNPHPPQIDHDEIKKLRDEMENLKDRLKSMEK
jgi:polyhydroxyalkanoate synthesis repressor PhaR